MATRLAANLSGLRSRAMFALPQGRTLPDRIWQRRHRALLGLLSLHAVGIPLFGISRGYGVLHSLAEGMIVSVTALLAVLVTRHTSSRKVASCIVAFGLLTCSVLIVHLSGGVIEAHFHFFVMLSLLLLYEDWVPYLLAFAYVVVHHGLLGALDPANVYNHPGAQADPWKWAAIHGVFVAAAGVANVAAWRFNEDVRAEAREAYGRVRESEARKSAILESALDAVLTIDHEGKIREFNPAAERIFGYARGEVLGKEMAELLVPPSFREAHRRGLGHYLETGVGPILGERIEVTAMRADGSEFPVELAITSVAVSGPPLFTGYLRDITERKEVEAERESLLAAEKAARAEAEAARGALTAQNERLRELDRLKDEFVALVSHELRTPLTSINGYLELVLEEEAGVLSDDQRHFLAVVERNAHRLRRLVDDLLFVAQVEAGRLRLELEEIELPTLVSDCLEAAQPVAHEKSISLIFDGGPVPPFTGDRARLAQVLDNLVGNALKFTPPGGRVTVTALARDGHALLGVADSGIGIPPAEREHLFERFFRASSATERAIPGTGLGLAIVSAIVDAHGGSIAVESEEGVGTDFRIELPLVREVGEIELAETAA